MLWQRKVGRKRFVTGTCFGQVKMHMCIISAITLVNDDSITGNKVISGKMDDDWLTIRIKVIILF